MIAHLAALVFLLTVDAPIKCELIDPSFCRHVQEAIADLRSRPVRDERDEATLRKLLEWAKRAQCAVKHDRFASAQNML